jgi:hypothetical protein
MKKTPLITALTLSALFCAAMPANATLLNSRVATWQVSHTPAGNVSYQLTPAVAGDMRGQIIFYRSGLPATRVTYNATSRIVTFHYSISELPAVQHLLDSATSLFINYDDVSGFGYLYSNHTVG